MGSSWWRPFWVLWCLGCVMNMVLGEQVRFINVWDATCGFPGEGPLGLDRIKVDEAVDGWLNFTRGGSLRTPSQIGAAGADRPCGAGTSPKSLEAEGAGRREEGPAVV